MNQTLTTTAGITAVFENFRMAPLPNVDQYMAKGRELLIQKMQPYVADNEPIPFVMLGYPFKSMNLRDKVLGTLPDLGEEVSLNNFGRFNDEVKKIYSPGIRMTIASDGLMFNDLMDISDHRVYEYRDIVQDMTRDLPIEWYTAEDFYSRRLNTSAVRARIEQQFGVSPIKLEQDILNNTDVNMLYRGMIRFMEGDLAINNYDSGNQLHREAKRMARAMMFRNESYSNLVRTEFKNHIRLSMHPSVNGGEKYSFALIPGDKIKTSPWHSALIQNPDGYETISRKEAEAAKLELVYKHARPYYYVRQN